MKNPLFSSKSLVVTLLVLAAVLCTTWAVGRSSTLARFTGSPGNSPSERIEQLIQLHEAQARRLDRLESLLATRAGRAPGIGSQTSTASHGADEHRDLPLTPAQAQQKIQGLIAQEESKFASEPLSASWAVPTEKQIDSAFSAKTLEWNQAPTPLSHEATCHSSSCRIEVSYQDDAQADIGQQFFLGDIATRLPKAKLFRLRNPDGTVQLVAYANTGRARR